MNDKQLSASENLNKMETLNFKIGQKINYANGGQSVFTGQIVKIKKDTLIVVDCEAGMEIWNAGGNVGSEINFTQIK